MNNLLWNPSVLYLSRCAITDKHRRWKVKKLARNAWISSQNVIVNCSTSKIISTFQIPAFSIGSDTGQNLMVCSREDLLEFTVEKPSWEILIYWMHLEVNQKTYDLFLALQLSCCMTLVKTFSLSVLSLFTSYLLLYSDSPL